jgi:hypothetical protein
MPPTNPNLMLRLTPLGNGRYAISRVAPPADPRPELALPDLDADYARAVAPWRAAGAPVATAHTYQARRATCAACPWLAPQPTPPRCEIPKRPCAKLRPWLTAEKCPLGNWPGQRPKTHQRAA